MKFVFFYFDGIAFFGFADFKLPRMLNKEPTFLDKFKSFKGITIHLSFAILLTFILVSQV